MPTGKHRRFGEPCLEPDDLGKLLRTVGNYLPIDMSPYSRSPESSNRITLSRLTQGVELTSLATYYVTLSYDTCCFCLYGCEI